jgi:hypothetical protein
MRLGNMDRDFHFFDLMFRCAAPLVLLCCSCSYKCFAALPLIPHCDVPTAESIIEALQMIANEYQLFRE